MAYDRMSTIPLLCKSADYQMAQESAIVSLVIPSRPVYRTERKAVAVRVEFDQDLVQTYVSSIRPKTVGNWNRIERNCRDPSSGQQSSVSHQCSLPDDFFEVQSQVPHKKGQDPLVRSMFSEYKFLQVNVLRTTT